PIVEEVVYRGMLYPALARVIGAVGGIVVVSLLFAGVHFYQYRNNLAVVAVITILSASLTTVRAYTHRLLPSFVIHLVFNGIQAILILVQGFSPNEPITPPPVPGVDLITLALSRFS
ncbi:MAG TPA: CPBP family intramembrane glutamic endopeptidase, partial [Pyrinomonadaceae bacterium]